MCCSGLCAGFMWSAQYEPKQCTDHKCFVGVDEGKISVHYFWEIGYDMKWTNKYLLCAQILKRRVSDANPTGINIPDSEMKCIKDKIREFQSQLAVRGDQWKEMKNLVDVVKDEMEDKSKTGQAQNEGWFQKYFL